MEVQEEEWEEDITVGFVPGNGGPRNQDLFFSAREGREFTQVLQEVQEYVSSKYATLLTGHDDADVKARSSVISQNTFRITGLLFRE